MKQKETRYNIEEIGRAIETLLVPGCTYELRALGTKGGTASGYFNDHLALGSAAMEYSGRCHGVYVVLNPVLPRLIHRSPNVMTDYVKKGCTTTDEDVTLRRWLLVDMDPVRPKGLSSTDEELGWAYDKAIAVRQYLQELGFEGLVLANSGNGFHVLVRQDRPNDPASRELASKLLRHLGEKFTDERVIVDPATFNAARLCKFYGTMSCKGVNSPENPHRISAILEVDSCTSTTS